jgi:hypothetical protein
MATKCIYVFHTILTVKKNCPTIRREGAWGGEEV